MVHQYLNLILAALLLLPPGVCPCHVHRDHPHSELHDCPLHTEEDSADADDCQTDSEHAVTEEQTAGHGDCPSQHHEKHSSDCLTRQWTESQFTSSSSLDQEKIGPAFVDFATALFDCPDLDFGGVSPAIRFTHPNSDTPIYLKVRALLL